MQSILKAASVTTFSKPFFTPGTLTSLYMSGGGKAAFEAA
jgi:hypothetical protein